MKQLEFSFGDPQGQIILAFMGPRRVGKSLATKFVAEEYAGTKCFAFADPLKKAAADIRSLTLEELEDRKEEFRPFLQKLGDIVRRELVDCPLLKIADKSREAFPSAEILAWADLRTQEEADWIRSKGGVIIAIEPHPAVDNSQDVDQHWTETECEKIAPDFVVINHGDQEAFRREVLNCVEWVKEQSKATPPQSAQLAN